MSKDKLIPELRFPEFQKDGEWEEKKIAEFVDLLSGYAFQSHFFSNQGQKLITPKNFTKEGYALFNNANTKYTTEISDDKFWCKEGDLLILITDLTPTCELLGKPVFLKKKDGEVLLNQRIIKVIPKRKISLHFLFQFFLTDVYHNRIKSTASGSTVRHSSNKIILDTNFQVPSLYEEQQRIAACLSSLDEVISAHSQKLELLKEHKKGLMQNLFPQEGEKVPKYRFKEFEKDGEWVETKLGDSAKFINGRAYKQEELLASGKYRVLRVGNFFTNNNWYYSDLELEEDKYCDDGDLLYAWSASFGPRVWKGEKAIYHYHIWKVLPANSISKDFLFVLLDNETERMKTQNANGFALLHITKGTIENWECSIPKSKMEQQKIATCLSSLDELITMQAEKIAQLKMHKKGLMQGMFPKISE